MEAAATWTCSPPPPRTSHAVPSLRQPYDPDSDDEDDASFGDVGSQGLDDEDEAAAAAVEAAALDDSWGVGAAQAKLTRHPLALTRIPRGAPFRLALPCPPAAGGRRSFPGGLWVCRGCGRDETRSDDSVKIVYTRTTAAGTRLPVQRARARS